MPPEKAKVFRDAIHGYISVPETYCKHFIDTALFQRLRNIEQTSMRILYPSAHHDRFAHSLGTFHLGCIAFDALESHARESARRTGSNIPEFDDDQWRHWRHGFKIACLMHDCGHAPFSHTFEEYYDLEKTSGERLVDKLIVEAGSPADTENLPDTPHEILSAYFVLTKFRDALREIDPGIDPVLMARMITGWDYSVKDDDKKRLESCLIKLLNGRAIDVDKLDYIIRDTWASGCDNTAVDTHRLLHSVSIGHYDSRLVLAFEKSALSVIQSVVTARNYLYRWIYSHHKVTYNQWLLKKAVRGLVEEFGFASGTEDEFLRELFSIEAIAGSKVIGGKAFSLLADGDIMHYLKKWAHDHPASEAAELLSRNHSRKALWKSYAEYCELFSPPIATEDSSSNTKLMNRFKSLIAPWEQRHRVSLNALVLEAYPKQVAIDSGSVHVNMPSGTKSYSEMKGLGGGVVPIPKFFYVYIDKAHIDRTGEILETVKKSL